MRRVIVGTIAAGAVGLLVAVPAWATHGGDAEPPGADIVPENANFETSAGGYTIDETTGAKRAFVRVALADVSLPRGLYTVLLYDTDGDRIPIGGQIMTGDGLSTALEFAGRDVDGDGQADGIRVDRASDDVIYACAITFYRGKIRDLAGYDSTGRCTTAAGAMELAADGTSPGGSGFE